jgi:hypothetical protein
MITGQNIVHYVSKQAVLLHPNGGKRCCCAITKNKEGIWPTFYGKSRGTSHKPSEGHQQHVIAPRHTNKIRKKESGLKKMQPSSFE